MTSARRRAAIILKGALRAGRLPVSTRNNTIRTIIVDDEPLAREKLRGYLESESDIEIVTEAGDGRSAVEAIENEKPDLVFLDVQMPELDGFQVIESLEVDPMPKVVFTTAYDQYAVKAFEVHAVDYLLKPFDRERFAEAMEKVRASVDATAGALDSMRDRLEALLQEVERERHPYRDRLVIKAAGRVVLLETEDIDWVDAAGNYVRLNAGEENHLLRETMNRLEERLDPKRFLRIHRSTIVNIERIKELQQQFHGDYLVVLKTGQRLTLSRSYRDRLQEILGRSL